MEQPDSDSRLSHRPFFSFKSGFNIALGPLTSRTSRAVLADSYPASFNMPTSLREPSRAPADSRFPPSARLDRPGPVRLLSVSAEVEFAFVFDETDSHLIEPTTSAQNITGEGFVSCEIDRHVE